MTAARSTPWTASELLEQAPKYLKNKSEWKLSASHNSSSAAFAADGKMDSRFQTDVDQVEKMWLKVELPQTASISGVRLDSGKSRGDFARELKVEVSMDGQAWSTATSNTFKGFGRVAEIEFSQRNAKFVRLSISKNAKSKWTIGEIDLTDGSEKETK